MANLLNAERVSIAFGTRILLDEVSLGLSTGDVIGVVGRNGSGKSTLLDLLTGRREPDSGQVVRTGTVSIGQLGQEELFAPGATVRDVIVGGAPDHVWAAGERSRAIVTQLLAGVDLDGPVAPLSGGEKRRVSLVALMLGGHDLLVLDEPTNHLDVEAVAWLADHLGALQARGTAMLVVSHDRWFLDAVCTRIWEVHDATVDAYEGGYAAYVLARAERARQAAANEARRQNLIRKELAWLRRGAPARTSKPKFRIAAANSLIADVPEPRDRLKLQEFSLTRLGKDVFDLKNVTYRLPASDALSPSVSPSTTLESPSSSSPSSPDSSPSSPSSSPPDPLSPTRTLFSGLDWSIGPGERIGLVGVNGTGKTTLLRLLTGELAPTSGRVKRGKTLRIGHLPQALSAAVTGAQPESDDGPLLPTTMDASERVLDSVDRLRRQTKLATGREASASSLLEEFGFTGERLVTRIGDLSGGERRRLQFLRLLLGEPNVLLLDEPTNDLDIDTLTVIEDYLDNWPGTLIVVTHDRYFLERVCDVTYALLGDGRTVLLPGGIDEYLDHRRHALTMTDPPPRSASRPSSPANAAVARQARKDLARVEGQLDKTARLIERLHHELAVHASDYERLTALGADLAEAEARHADLEAQWLDLAETLESTG